MNNIDLGRYKRIVQYFWDPEPRNEEGVGSRVWCLGREYVTKDDDNISYEEQRSSPVALEESTPEESIIKSDKSPSSNAEQHINSRTPSGEETKGHGWPKAFLDDFESRFWLTYRSNFQPIAKSEDPSAALSMTLSVRLRSQLVESHGFTSDTGWGCMIRSGQSLLANALSILTLGRDWRRGAKNTEESHLLSLFADDPDAPFSIHRFVKYGASACGKHPGEWFGPSATARCIQALSGECKDAGLNVYVTSDSSDVFEDRFRAIACGESEDIHPTLILLGIRLGIHHVTPAYRQSLEATLKLPQSVGIAGGRPSASHYFVGVQDSYFFYLDPHHTRPSFPFRGTGQMYTQEELDSYHTRRLRRLHIEDMDPSMLIGFLIKDEDDWIDWKRRILSAQGKPIVNIFNLESRHSSAPEREGALDEVEALDDDDEN